MKFVNWYESLGGKITFEDFVNVLDKEFLNTLLGIVKIMNYESYTYIPSKERGTLVEQISFQTIDFKNPKYH